MLDRRFLSTRVLAVSRPMLGALAVVATSACASVQGRAQSMCFPDTADYSIAQRDWVVDVVTASDTAGARRRSVYNLPAVAASEVAMVTEHTACMQAAQVMAAQYNRQVYPVVLIRIGTGRYFVYDGEPVAGLVPTLVLDQNFAVLEKLVSRP
jgi:hypothetical protein